jgi:hypothetical protein
MGELAKYDARSSITEMWISVDEKTAIWEEGQ